MLKVKYLSSAELKI